MSKIIIGEEDKEKTFKVSRGDSIVISLGENPSTGYLWKVCAVDKEILDMENSEFSIFPSTGIGGGGIRSFHFKVALPGSTKIQLKLQYPWEGSNSSIKDFMVYIDAL
ncbi:MAG: hypothetical protein B0A82_08495 [Alkalinema sp. CACIAM 70d]|nr:MAG: hypothetical protein B0A82_08495 [Alkalinema sp. CACIAM 70d]